MEKGGQTPSYLLTEKNDKKVTLLLGNIYGAYHYDEIYFLHRVLENRVPILSISSHFEDNIPYGETNIYYAN